MPKIVIGLKEGISIEETPGGGVELKSAYIAQTLSKTTPGTVKALLMLAAGGSTQEELEDMARAEDWFLSNLPQYIEQLARLGFLTWSVLEDGQSLARLVVIGQGFNFHLSEIGSDQRFVLSRFAYSRCLNQKTVLETPLQPVRLELDGWLGMALWGLLSRPATYPELCAAIPGADSAIVKLLLQLFAAAGMIQPADEAEGGIPEDRDVVLRLWEFHDLLFHTRTRDGRQDQPLGATFRFWPGIEPLPACKPSMQGELIELAKPNLEHLIEEDYPFTLVLEERHSIRDYAPEAITLQQIGEFLYRAARVKGIRPADPERGAMYEASARPYPGGGACHELEIYLTVGECRGLDRGLYHYDPLGHSLTKLCSENRCTGLILKQAEGSAAKQCQAQVVINLTARFPRLSWKYNSIAYALMLKDVGALYQTMYLVATAMDLAPCALGAGHADWLCQAAGLNYLAESPVGEFLLGSKRI
ncbi:SagB-type dehydrogenase domain protein [Desulfosporosinus orientis DSM 765]|uniref:SagB-type dehydrogenase domain protein n=2 Tax=Desulfosporosinus orientis TaxID=1563 RepID=G7W6U4_DESOD|nr:SagB-type dehydrogenase domain protein [Desulfosporosinus orientis DSM 765]